MGRRERFEKLGSSIWLPFALFGAWVAVLLGALLLEGTAVGRIFDRQAGLAVYIVLQLALTVATLAVCTLVLVRGSSSRRFVVLLPAAVLVYYVALAISGPG